MKAAAAALLALLAAGCVQGSYNRITVDEPLRDEMVAPLRPGQDTLAQCLARLGAPHRVYEYRVGQDGVSGAALLWVWREAAGWGIEALHRAGAWPTSLCLSCSSLHHQASFQLIHL